MTLRRYQPIKASRGTVIPPSLRLDVKLADFRKIGFPLCVGRHLRMPGDCFGPTELDHVRASHGIGMKSDTVRGNLVYLCGVHHRLKTLNGKTWRPKLIDYIAKRDRRPLHADHH